MNNNSNYTVSQWFHSGNCNYLGRPVKERTHAAHISCFENHIRPIIGDHVLNHTTNEEIIKIFSDMQRDGYSYGSLIGVYAVITRIFKSAVRDGVTSNYPCLGIHSHIESLFNTSERN